MSDESRPMLGRHTDFSRDHPRSEEERSFSRAYFEFQMDWSRLETFRVVTEAGLSTGWTVIRDAHIRRIEEIEATIDFPTAHEFLAADHLEMLRKSTEADAMSSIRQATIVFAHSLFDHFVIELCVVAATCSPGKMRSRLAKRKVTVEAALSTDPDSLLKAEIGAFLDELGRQSLRKRIGFLFELCPLPDDFTPITGFVPDIDRLERIDNVRHGIVHLKPLTLVPDDTGAVVGFMSDFADFLTSLLAHHFNIQVRTGYALPLIERPSLT